MTREHAPIQIGLPPEPAWLVGEPTPFSVIAFVGGDELPDPGEAFIAAGRAFGTAPVDVEPVPMEDESVAWAFSFGNARRESRVFMWCERADAAKTPDFAASDAKWVVFLETLLDTRHALDDAIALAATVARAAGPRTRLLYDPMLGTAWKPEEFADLFLGEGDDRGALIDERHLYRVEVNARDRVAGPYWISTVGLSRLAKPELELLEVPVNDVRAALELIDALAARFVTETLPAAGVPFEAGPDLRLALVPASEVMITLAPGAPGDAADRRLLPRGPRAAVCAAGKRGSFRAVWVAPLDELARLSRNDTGVFLAPRVVDVRAAIARREWPTFVAAFAATAPSSFVPPVFLVKIARGDVDGERVHVWLRVTAARLGGGSGLLVREGTEPESVSFALAAVGDWRVLNACEGMAEVGPESAHVLR